MTYGLPSIISPSCMFAHRHRYQTLWGAITLLISLLPQLQSTAQPAETAAQPVDVSTRTINEITIPATHNSYNYAPAFQAPNVNESVAEQLKNGIRAIELDFKYLGKEIQLFHGLGGVLGAQPAADVLTDISTFIQQNPTETVAIKVHSRVPGPALAALMEQTGLSPYLYTQKGRDLPTLETLTQSDRRVLILNAPRPISSRLRLCTTRWNLKTPAALWPPREHAVPCTGDFFSVVAYAVDGTLGTGSLEHAAVINDPPYLLKLAETAWKLNGKKVWRLEVDFPDIGDVYGVAATLNRWNILKGEVRHQGKVLPKVTWNCEYSMGDTVNTVTYGRFSFPVKPQETVKITPSHPDFVFSPASITVTDTKGQDVMQVFNAKRRP